VAKRAGCAAWEEALISLIDEVIDEVIDGVIDGEQQIVAQSRKMRGRRGMMHG
jgi:hypothetical protein